LKIEDNLLLSCFKELFLTFLLATKTCILKFFITNRKKQKIQLTPAYDFLNTTIAMANPEEELALSLKGKKKGFKKSDFVLFAVSDLCMTDIRANKEINTMLSVIPEWIKMIDHSFLSIDMNKEYKNLVTKRAKRLSG